MCGTCWGGTQPRHPRELPHHLLWQLGGGTGWTHLWFSPMSSAASYTGDGHLLAPWSPEWGVGEKDGSPPLHGDPGTLGMTCADTDASEERLHWDWSSLQASTLSWLVHPCWETHGEGSGTRPRLGRGPLPSSSSAPMQCHGAAARPAPSSGCVAAPPHHVARQTEGRRQEGQTDKVWQGARQNSRAATDGVAFRGLLSGCQDPLQSLAFPADRVCRPTHAIEVPTADPHARPSAAPRH